MSWITLEQAKQRLGIDCTDPSYDDAVQSAIDYSIALVETYCHRNFAEEQQDESYLPVPRVTYLKNWPVASIDDIQLDGVVQSDVTYTLDPMKGIVYFNSGWTTWDHTSLLTITYTAGYAVIPTDLLEAALDVVMARYNTVDDDPSRGPVKFERIDGSVSVSYGDPAGSDSSTGLLSPHLMVLNTYRSERTQGAW